MTLPTCVQNLKTLASIFQRYRQDPNVKISDWFHYRSSSLSAFNRKYTTSYSPFIETVHLSCTVFWDIESYLSKVANFSHSMCIWCLRWGWTHWISPSCFASKARVPALPWDVICLMILLFVLIKYRLVTEMYIQTVRHTQGHSVYRGSLV